jgi:hypothetical protein
MSDRQAAQSRSGGNTSAGFRFPGPRLRTNFPRILGNQIDYEAMKRQGFHEQGIIVAKLDDHRLDEFERQFLKNIGSKLFGQKPEA